MCVCVYYNELLFLLDCIITLFIYLNRYLLLCVKLPNFIYKTRSINFMKQRKRVRCFFRINAFNLIRFVEPAFYRVIAFYQKYRITANGIHTSTMSRMRPVTPDRYTNPSFNGHLSAFVFNATCICVHFAKKSRNINIYQYWPIILDALIISSKDLLSTNFSPLFLSLPSISFSVYLCLLLSRYIYYFTIKI